MDKYIPIRFEGGNMGDRQKFMNWRVQDAIKQNVPFEVIKSMQGQSTVDRLFMIDYASKCQNLEYVIENLKDTNMLFVARALKSTWLITDPRHAHVVNPKYLVDELFPQMMTTAVNKMLHSIYIHLKDEERCYDFYQHYKLTKNMEIAKHFLKRCSKNVILSEVQLFLDDISPHYLKVICEKCPDVYKKYFDVISKNEKAYRNFNLKKTKYFNVLKVILKRDPKIYFDILEQYYDSERSNYRLSLMTTKYIMQNHKDKYLAKPELYGGAILHLPALARCLSEEEAKDLVLRLARAQYLAPWFTLTYKSGEPLLKRINEKERRELVKKIFKDKTFGDLIHVAPYPLPKKVEINTDENVFSDSSNKMKKKVTKRILKKKKGIVDQCQILGKTLLDQLFDKYRFTGFFQAFHELKKRLQIENSHQNRLMILNVLVSKTLKRAEHVQALLELVSTKHANEPINLQASFVRSLVRRAAAYRLPDEPWQIFYGIVWRIIFQSEEYVPCEEGLHAILIHNVLNDLDTAPEITEKFNTLFNPLVDYDLTTSEKRQVCDYLYQMLLNRLETCMRNNLYEDACGLIYNLLHLLRAHKVSIKTRPEILCVIKRIAERDLTSCKNILEDLYKAKIGRDIFMKENFILRHNEESYINALRHDVTLVIDTDAFEEHVINSDRCKFKKFFSKLKLYFEELASKYLLIIENKIQIINELSLKLAAGLCILQEPAVVWTMIKDVYAKGKEKHQLAERLAANVHLAWSYAQTQEEIHMDVGVIASRNALSALPAAALRAQLPRLLTGPAPFVRLALTLAFDRLLPFDVLKIVSHLRQDRNREMKRFLLIRFYKYMRLRSDNIPPDMWNEFKTLMVEMVPYYKTKLWNLICDVDAFANVFKMEYCMTIVRITSFEDFKLKEMNGLVEIFSYINDNIEKASKFEVMDILQYFLKNDFHSLKFIKLCEDYDFNCLVRIKISILVKFLLTCETETEQREALENVAEPFLNTVRVLWNHKLIPEYFELFLYGLKYNRAYLNISYVSNTPVFEVILKFMQSFLDVKKYFHLYSRVHLTMIYRETLKRLQERHPNLLAEPTDKTEAAMAVGAVLAGYLAREHRQLRKHYFPAITDIYAHELFHYINHYSFGSGAVSRKFKVSLIRGLIASDDDENVYLAAVLFFCMEWHQTPHLNDPDVQKILTLFENCKCAKIQCCLSVNLL